MEPRLLPARLPNLLINGSQGIAVGMTTYVPPHNLSEVVDALVLVAQKPAATLDDVLAVLPGPDFPTGGEMLGRAGVRAMYETGHGSVQLRGRAAVEEVLVGRAQRRTAAVVLTELPYETDKSALVARIAALIDGGKLPDAAAVRDESDRDGMRVVVETKRGGDAAALRDAIFAHTAAQTRVSARVTALLGQQPRTWPLLDILRAFVAFRCEVIEKRARAQLAVAEARAHLVARAPPPSPHAEC